MNQLKVDFKEFVQALFTWKYWRMLLVLALGCLLSAAWLTEFCFLTIFLQED